VTNYVTVVNYREQPQRRENDDYSPRNAVVDDERQTEERERTLLTTMRQRASGLFTGGEVAPRCRAIHTARGQTETETESEISADTESSIGMHDGDKTYDRLTSCSCRLKSFHALEVRLFYFIRDEVILCIFATPQNRRNRHLLITLVSMPDTVVRRFTNVPL